MEFRTNLREGIVGAILWGVTGFYCFLIAFTSVAWYLVSTRATYSMDGKPAALVFFPLVFVVGFLWGVRNPDGQKKRVEAIVWLLVLGFVLPLLANLLAASFPSGNSLATFSVLQIVAHILVIFIAYGLVYGLDLVVFLPDESESAREWDDG